MCVVVFCGFFSFISRLELKGVIKALFHVIDFEWHQTFISATRTLIHPVRSHILAKRSKKKQQQLWYRRSSSSNSNTNTRWRVSWLSVNEENIRYASGIEQIYMCACACVRVPVCHIHTWYWLPKSEFHAYFIVHSHSLANCYSFAHICVYAFRHVRCEKSSDGKIVELKRIIFRLNNDTENKIGLKCA